VVARRVPALWAIVGVLKQSCTAQEAQESTC